MSPARKCYHLLEYKFFRCPSEQQSQFPFIEFADIDIVSTSKKFDANDILINSAIVHISTSQNCVSNTAVTQIKFLRTFEIFPATNIVSFNIIKHKGITQILDVPAYGHMIGRAHLLSAAD